jgi:SnoaL-like domain
MIDCMSDHATRVDETVRRMQAAVEAGDLDGFMGTLSPEAVLRSPISVRAEFRGAAEMRELMRSVFDTIEDIRYYEDLGDHRARAVFYRARIGSQPIEEACLLRFDEEARIDEFVLWIRPMPGITRLARHSGASVGARQESTARGPGSGCRKAAFLADGDRGQAPGWPGPTETHPARVAERPL